MADATGPKKTRVQSALFMCNFNAVRSLAAEAIAELDPAKRAEIVIKAQQEIDKVEQDKRIAAQKAREEKLRGQFKQVDDAMSKWGL